MADLRLSPITWLSMTLSHELDLDKDGTIFDQTRYERYVAMYNEAIRRRDAALKTLVIADFCIIVLISGKNITVPGFAISLGDIPAALEFSIMLASMGWLFGNLAFLTEQAYQTVLRGFNQKEAKKAHVDPEFLSASDFFFDFFVKLYRRKMNIWGVDFYSPGAGYRRFFGFLMVCITCALLLFVVFHFLAVGAGIQTAYTVRAAGILSLVACAVAVFANVAGLLVGSTMLKEFHFESLPDDPPRADNSANPST